MTTVYIGRLPTYCYITVIAVNIINIIFIIIKLQLNCNT